MYKTVKIVAEVFAEKTRKVVGDGTVLIKQRIESEKIRKFELSKERKDIIGNEKIQIDQEIEERKHFIERLTEMPQERILVKYGYTDIEKMEKKEDVINFHQKIIKDLEAKRKKLIREFDELCDLLEKNKETEDKIQERKEIEKRNLSTIKSPDKDNVLRYLIPELYEVCETTEEGRIYQNNGDLFSFRLCHRKGVVEFVANGVGFYIDTNLSLHKVIDSTGEKPILLAEGRSMDIGKLKWKEKFIGEHEEMFAKTFNILRFVTNNMDEIIS